MTAKADCRGMACPQPVLKAKELIEAHPGEIVEVVVDNEAARQNVSRFLESQGWSVSVSEKDGLFTLTAAPGRCDLSFQQEAAAPRDHDKVLVFIPSCRLGEGDEGLGAKLMANFLATLKEMEGLWRIILVNSGVTLAAEGSETAPILADLEKKGAEVLVCGTCLEHYGLMGKTGAGATTNMLDIVTSMSLATKVVRI